MQNIRKLITPQSKHIYPKRKFGILKDVYGTVRTKDGKVLTAQQRLERGWKQEHDRLKEKYVDTKTPASSPYYYSPQYLEKFEKYCLDNFPAAKPQLQAYINEYKKQDADLIKDFIKKGHLQEITPMSFEDQQNIVKILAQEKGDESDYDSDVPVDDEVRFNRRLFNYIKIQDRLELPPMREEDKDKKTLFIEIDDLLIHTFIPDENVGYIANSASKDPDKTLFLKEARLNILYYQRDYLKEFLEYIDKNFEPILFTTSQSLYADYVINQFDPEDKIFRHRLYQNSCYMLEK